MSEQISTLDEMNKNLNTLIEHKCVIAITGQVIAGTIDEEIHPARPELEENKQEI